MLALVRVGGLNRQWLSGLVGVGLAVPLGLGLVAGAGTVCGPLAWIGLALVALGAVVVGLVRLLLGLVVPLAASVSPLRWLLVTTMTKRAEQSRVTGGTSTTVGVFYAGSTLLVPSYVRNVPFAMSNSENSMSLVYGH